MNSPLPALGLVVAYSIPQRAIGASGGLPWHEPEDLQHFKRVTMGHAIIHGRKSYESFGRPLPGRRNIIVTRNTDYQAPGCEVVHDLESAIARARSYDDCPWVCGGEAIYRAALPFVTICELTEITLHLDAADTFFPELDESAFVETKSHRSGHLHFRRLERTL
ncbi:MAG: dihydrofolate reductase [Planctomycetota bacterium]|nr:MAG: dihydrofolate reductase [Planctomycetota bacterium]